MSFDKEDYQANREAGWRGQGEYPETVRGFTPPEHVKQGEVGSRKARRAEGMGEVHGRGRRRRGQV